MISEQLKSDPTQFIAGTDEFNSLSYLGFSQIKELVDTTISDRVKRQTIYKAIYGKTLAASQFAISQITDEQGTGRVGTTGIEIHEKTHFANDRQMPTQLPENEVLQRVERARTEFFQDEPISIWYDSVTDKINHELSNTDLVRINHTMMNMVAGVVSSDQSMREAYLNDASRNARDEIVAITVETIANENSRHLRTIAFAKYATSGCHYFDREPNLDIAILRSLLLHKKSPEAKRQAVLHYLQHGFTDEEVAS